MLWLSEPIENLCVLNATKHPHFAVIHVIYDGADAGERSIMLRIAACDDKKRLSSPGELSCSLFKACPVYRLTPGCSDLSWYLVKPLGTV